MNVNTERSGDIVVMTIKGNIMGGPDADTFYGMVKQHLDQGDRKFVLNLAGVKLMNSSVNVGNAHPDGSGVQNSPPFHVVHGIHNNGTVY